MSEWVYKQIIKDEKSLIEYLEYLVSNDEMDIKNKVFSAAMAGRFFEKEQYLWKNKDLIVDKFFESLEILKESIEKGGIKT